MKEILWDRKEVSLEEYDALQAEYYLLIDEIKIGETLFCENYGIKLRLWGDGTEELAMVPCVSPNAKQMTVLMNLLSQNVVTPTTLSDVLDDWLA